MGFDIIEINLVQFNLIFFSFGRREPFDLVVSERQGLHSTGSYLDPRHMEYIPALLTITCVLCTLYRRMETNSMLNEQEMELPTLSTDLSSEIIIVELQS